MIMSSKKQHQGIWPQYQKNTTLPISSSLSLDDELSSDSDSSDSLRSSFVIKTDGEFFCNDT